MAIGQVLKQTIDQNKIIHWKITLRNIALIDLTLCILVFILTIAKIAVRPDFGVLVFSQLTFAIICLVTCTLIVLGFCHLNLDGTRWIVRHSVACFVVLNSVVILLVLYLVELFYLYGDMENEPCKLRAVIRMTWAQVAMSVAERKCFEFMGQLWDKSLLSFQLSAVSPSRIWHAASGAAVYGVNALQRREQPSKSSMQRTTPK